MFFRPFLIISYFLLSIMCHDIKADTQEYRDCSIEKLGNGISIVFIDTTKSNSILVMLCIAAGCTDELDKKGVANLLSKVFSKKLNENADALHYGTVSNSFAGYDQSAYYFYGKQENLEGFIKNLGSVYSNFTFSADDLNMCKQSVEQNIIADNQIDKIVISRESKKSLYWHSGYGNNIAGDVDELALISESDLQAFKDKNYKNCRSVVIIAGNVNKKSAIEMVKKYFEKKDLVENKVERLKEPPHHGASTKITKYSDQINVPVIEMYWKIPSYVKDKNAALATELFINTLDETLQYSLINKQKLVASISFTYSFWNYDEGDFCITITPRNTDNLDEIINAVITEIKYIVCDGITQKQLDTAIKKLHTSSLFVGKDVVDVVNCISKRMSSGSDFDFIKTYPTFVKKGCELQVVNDQGKAIFKQDPQVITVIIPKSKYNK